jgi:hypothetical protein
MSTRHGARPVPQCRSCGAPILWAVSKDGKRMPLNIDRSPGLVVEGEQSDGTPIVASRPVYTSHFSTCPDADDWRRE